MDGKDIKDILCDFEFIESWFCFFIFFKRGVCITGIECF